MSHIFKLFLVGSFLLLWTAPSWAQIPGPRGLNTGATATTATVNASNEADQVVASMSYGFMFTIPTTAPAIWLFPLDAGTACSTVTAATGARFSAGDSYWCSPYDMTSFCFNWWGQICGIREDGSGDVDIIVIGR